VIACLWTRIVEPGTNPASGPTRISSEGGGCAPPLGGGARSVRPRDAAAERPASPAVLPLAARRFALEVRRDVGGAFEDVECLAFSVRGAEVAAIGSKHAGVLADGAVRLEQRDRFAVGVVGIRVAGAHAGFGDRPPGVALLIGELRREQERLPGEALGS
jgi:hypothetical protein